MLGVNKYSKEYIDNCRSKISEQLNVYKKLISASVKQADKTEKTVSSAIASFEPVFFNNMVIVLDALFVHRLRGVEGKDGNPLNEVRVLCNSIMNKGNVLTPDNTIKLNPEKSFLKYKTGDAIKITETQFALLSKAFFDEIEKKFV